VDHSAQWNTHYTYTVVAQKGTAQSLPSLPQEANSADIFPPSAPTDVTAAASANTIEVAWQRSPESDVKGYNVYRSVGDGPFEKQGALIALPAYTDKNVEHGKTYRYEVSAVSAAGKESDKSAPAETVFP
jgi:fibronectin type 3 domain-containing protein